VVRQREEIERFARLIITRTGKPLRDLSGYASEFATDPGAIARAGILSHSMKYQQFAAPMAGIPTAKQPKRFSPRGCALVLLLLLLPFVLVGGVFGAKWKLHDYQASYYASLPAKLHAQRPLYFSDFSSSDGSWYERAATAENPFGYVFADDGYHLTGLQSKIIDSWSQFRFYFDAAVEVTASQTAGTTYDGVGLVLHSDWYGNNMVVFFASPTDGSWSLLAYHFGHPNPDDNWTYLASGTSSAIRIGDLQPNRLLAIMRGAQYLLYINNQLVDSYYDSYHDTPRSGYVGVYVNEANTEGIFTNFAVYQVKPPPSLEYV
jgi:hypothetical protein